MHLSAATNLTRVIKHTQGPTSQTHNGIFTLGKGVGAHSEFRKFDATETNAVENQKAN